MERIINTQHRTQQFILLRDGQAIIYDINDAQIVLRRRGGVWVKYLTGQLPSGTRFKASYGQATAAEVRRWQRANDICPAQRCAACALHALADRLAEMVGLDRALTLFTRAISTAEGMV